MEIYFLLWFGILLFSSWRIVKERAGEGRRWIYGLWVAVILLGTVPIVFLIYFLCCVKLPRI